jgi:hypothetical protein
MNNDAMAKECPMTNAQRPTEVLDHIGFGNWSLKLGHSLVIGRWSLVI